MCIHTRNNFFYHLQSIYLQNILLTQRGLYFTSGANNIFFFFFACALSCTSHVKTVQCLQSTLMYFVFIYSACIHKCCCVAVTSMLIFVRCRLIYVNARVIIIISENEKALKEVWGVFEFFIIILFFISQFFLFLRFMMEDKKREIKSNLFFNKNLAAFFCNSFFYNTVCFFFNYLNLPCFVVLIIDL